MNIERSSKHKGIPLKKVPEKYLQDIQVFNRWLGPRDLTPTIVKEYFSEMKFQYSGETLRKKKAAIKKSIITTIGAEMNKLQLFELDEFFKTIKTPKSEDKVYPDEVLSIDELRTLIRISGKKTSLIIEALYVTACRVSELVNIRIKDCEVRADSVIITVNGKGSKIRSVYMHPETFERVLEAYKGKKYLFEVNKKPLSRFTVHNLLKKAGAKIGRSDIHAHTLRHSFGTHRLADLGIDGVSDYLGHASAETTAKYYLHNKPTAASVLGGERL